MPDVLILGPGAQGILTGMDTPVLAPGPVFLEFEISGNPRHKARHRSRIVPGTPTRAAFIQNYPDPETARYEEMLKEYTGLLMSRHQKQPTSNPVALLVHSFRPIPRSWSQADQRRAAMGAILPTSRPDWDNYGKITDALNGVVWMDDSQVCDGRVIKRYSEHPALRIEIREFLTMQDVAHGPQT